MNNTDFSGHKVLVVEDNKQNYRLIEYFARKRNVEVLWAENGLEAIELFKRHTNISLVMMDAMMPNMDGFEATRQIKAIRPEVPIVMITGFVCQESLRMAVAAGCNDYLSKPVGTRQLMATFTKWLIK